MIASALLSGTLALAGGLTPSSESFSLPVAPPWASSVRVRVRHTTAVTFGWETDQFGGDVSWSAEAVIRTGWALRSEAGPIASSRARIETVQGGFAVPFDGAIDWAGASGSSASYVVPTESAWISMPIPSGPLTLSTRAASGVGISITAPFVPQSGGTVMWVNHTAWSAAVDWQFE